MPTRHGLTALVPVVSHRLLFAPELELIQREQGREEALRLLFARCLELAPRPEPQVWRQTG